MSKGIDVKFVCNLCDKEIPIDKEKSTANWKVYQKACPCGGKPMVKVSDW
jgi:DNA-directed RNA polymerase subunit RPC12/RpoP